MAIRAVFILMTVVLFAGSNPLQASINDASINFTNISDQPNFLLADTRSKDRRDNRQDDRGRSDDRDDRQDCRQEEGVGKDKRDCKQDARQGENDRDDDDAKDAKDAKADEDDK